MYDIPAVLFVFITCSTHFYTNNLNNCRKPRSNKPKSTPTNAETTITNIVNRVACSRVGHTTLLSSPMACLKKLGPKPLPNPADGFWGLATRFPDALAIYLVSLCDLCCLQRGQYLESSMRCGSLLWFLIVV